MSQDNLNPVTGNLDPKRAMKRAAHVIFGSRIRWDDGDKDAQIATLKSQLAVAGDWKANLSSEAKAYPGLAKFATPESVLTGYVELEKTLGKNKIVMLSDNPTPEEKTIFYNKLGRPEKSDGYKLAEKIDGVPDDLPKNDVMRKGFLEAAHTAGLSQKATTDMHEWYMKTMAAEYQQLSDEHDTDKNKTETDLRIKWGKGYDANVARAKKVIESFAGDDAKAFLAEGPGNNLVLVNMLSEIGKHLSEDVLGIGAGKRLTLSAEQAKVEVATIMNDYKGPYYNREHAEHNAIVEKVAQLNQIIYPEETTIT